MYVETKLPTPKYDEHAPPSDLGVAILFVDDDPNILDGFRRQFRKKFRIHTAAGALEALQDIVTAGPFGVVISDLQMPGMDGVQFLTRVRAVSPDTVRVMLTGRAEISTAMAAVNQGNIFRFLIKPCAPVVIEKVLEAAIDQHKLVIAERQLTQETLLGCVQVLVEMLGIVHPDAFGRAPRVRLHVRRIAAFMGLKDAWQLEIAALLSQIGWITLRPNLLAKAVADQSMSEEERASFLAHAGAAARILEKIPRFGSVARMIESQHLGLKGVPAVPLPDPDVTAVGAQVLKAAIDFDRFCKKGAHPLEALDKMRRDSGKYMPEILAAMAAVEETAPVWEVRQVPVSELTAGMIMEEELRSEQGLMILGKGQEVTATFAERLLSFDYGLALDRLCKVRA